MSFNLCNKYEERKRRSVLSQISIHPGANIIYLLLINTIKSGENHYIYRRK